jgi:thiamine-monophosphate kinase
VTEDWLRGFASGLGSWVQGKLLGGDLVATPGPLTLSITAIGEVPEGRMVRRATAQPGDTVYVTGVIGGSMLGLQILNGEEQSPFPKEARALLISDYHYPKPPVGLTGVIREYATAAMDLSDGLVRDASRMCDGSGVGMNIDGASVPLRPCVRDRINEGKLDLSFPLTAGDDYQVLMTVAADKANAFEQVVRDTGDVPVTCIGIVTSSGRELVVQDANGERMVFGETGHDHFRAHSK